MHDRAVVGSPFSLILLCMHLEMEKHACMWIFQKVTVMLLSLAQTDFSLYIEPVFLVIGGYFLEHRNGKAFMYVDLSESHGHVAGQKFLG